MIDEEIEEIECTLRISLVVATVVFSDKKK